MKEVLFKFDIDQKVLVKAVDEKEIIGIIQMCAYDRGGISYYINMGENTAWWHEDQLMAVPTK